MLLSLEGLALSVSNSSDVPLPPLQMPSHRLSQLTTAIDTVRFNGSGELLLFASSRKDGAARLVHLPARTVFDNWPGKKVRHFDV